MNVFNVIKEKVQGKTLVISLIAIFIAVGFFLMHQWGEDRAENRRLAEQVQVLERAREADAAALAVRERGRASAEGRYRQNADRLSTAGKSAPEWAAQEVPESVLEALR